MAAEIVADSGDGLFKTLEDAARVGHPDLKLNAPLWKWDPVYFAVFQAGR